MEPASIGRVRRSRSARCGQQGVTCPMMTIRRARNGRPFANNFKNFELVRTSPEAHRDDWRRARCQSARTKWRAGAMTWRTALRRQPSAFSRSRSAVIDRRFAAHRAANPEPCARFGARFSKNMGSPKKIFRRSKTSPACQKTAFARQSVRTSKACFATSCARDGAPATPSSPADRGLPPRGYSQQPSPSHTSNQKQISRWPIVCRRASTGSRTSRLAPFIPPSPHPDQSRGCPGRR
jgi:hypothetical protein